MQGHLSAALQNVEQVAGGVVIDIPSDAFFTGILAIYVVGGVAIVTTLVITFVRTWHPTSRERLVNRHALRANLVVPEALRPALEHQLAMRGRGGIIGGLVGLAAVMLLFRPWEYPPVNLGLAGAPLSIGLAMLGTQLGAILGGALARRALPLNGAVSRVTPIGLTDLVAGVELRMAAVAAAVAVALPTLLLVVTALPSTDASESITASAAPLALLGLGSGALFLALPAIARRLTRRRALLGDTSALAWSDALAAQSLRDLLWVIASVGGLAGFSSLMAMGVALPSEANVAAMIWMNVSAYAGVVLLLLLIALVLVRSPERHVQRTLWPEFAIDAQ